MSRAPPLPPVTRGVDDDDDDDDEEDALTTDRRNSMPVCFDGLFVGSVGPDCDARLNPDTPVDASDEGFPEESRKQSMDAQSMFAV